MITRREKLVALKNAIANVVRGSASAVVALVLPPFLTRSMDHDAFGAWSLVLQLSAYVGYLDFGIQTAIARFVAHATERRDSDHLSKILGTSVVALSALAGAAACVIAILVAFLGRLFPHLRPDLLPDVRLALLFVGLSLALGLPASVFAGIFVGLQRNELPAAVIGGSRLMSAVMLVWLVRSGGSLAGMGAILALTNVTSYLVLYWLYRRQSSQVPILFRKASWATARELFDYCFSLSIWNFSMLLVTGLDLTLVGMFRFGDVAFYAVASTVVNFLVGVFGSIFAAMASPAAVLHAREDRQGLGRMVIASTRFGMILLLATGLPLILAAEPLLRIWVGAEYASQAAVFVKILVAANIVRTCSVPYATAMVASGEQRRVILSPILEGFTNLFFSVLLGRSFGALGVALGTLIGAVVGLGCNVFYNMRRTTEIQFSIREYVGSAIARPFLCVLPLAAAAGLRYFLPSLEAGWQAASWVLTAAASAGLMIRFALSSDERMRIAASISSSLRVRGSQA